MGPMGAPRGPIYSICSICSIYSICSNTYTNIYTNICTNIYTNPIDYTGGAAATGRRPPFVFHTIGVYIGVCIAAYAAYAVCAAYAAYAVYAAYAAYAVYAAYAAKQHICVKTNVFSNSKTDFAQTSQ